MADDSGSLEDDLRSILADDSDDGTGASESALPDPEARYRGTVLENAPFSENIEDRRTTLNDDPSQPGRSVDTTPHTSGYGPLGTGGGWDTLGKSMWFAAGGDVPDPAEGPPAEGWTNDQFQQLAPQQEPPAAGWTNEQFQQLAPQQEPPAEGWTNDQFQQLAPQQGDKPPAEGVGKSMVRTLIHGAAPFVGSLPGMVAGGELGGEAGAALGLPAAPFTGGLSVPVLGFIGMMLGGAAGAAITGGATQEAQDWMENAVGISDAPQREANAAAHPYATGAAEVLPNALAFKVGPLAGSLASRALMGAGMGGLTAAEEYAETGEFDKGEIAKQFALGAAFNQERSGTAKALNPVRAAVGRLIPGRPGVTTTADDAQALKDSEVPPPPVGSVGTAAENGPNDADRRLPPDVASRLQTATLATVRDRGNQGIYKKDAATSDNSPLVSTGDIQPNVQAALDANKAPPPPAEPAKAAAPQGGEPPPSQVTGQSLGIVEGAKEQGMLGTRQPTPGEEPATVAAATDVQNPKLPDISVEKADLPPGYIARSNNDGTKVYVSPNMPDQMNVNGHVFNPAEPLAVHEILERHRIAQIQDAITAGQHPPMSDDAIYASAHEYAGTAGERAYLQEHVGTPQKPFTDADFAEYQRQMKNLSVQNKSATGTPPPDLYRFMDDQHYAATHVHQAGDDALATAQMQRQATDAVHAKVRAGQGEYAGVEPTGSLNPDRAAAPQEAVKPAPQQGIPFMITAKMKADLAARGVSPEDIRNMTPAQAHERLQAAPQASSPVDDALANFGKPGAVTATVNPPPGLARALELIKANPDIPLKAKAEFAQKLQTATPAKIQQVYNHLRRNRPTVNGVQARDAGDLARKQGAIDAATRAFQKFPPGENETIVNSKLPSLKAPDKAALITRLKSALAEGGAEALSYKANDTPAEVQWMHEAKRIVGLADRGKLYPKQLTEFMATEKALRSGNKEAAREVQANKRAEADIAKSRRSGDEAVEQATAKNYGPGRNEVEDELIDKIDRARSGQPEDEDHTPFDVPEEAHESAPKEATAESMKAQAAKSREAVDLTKLSHEELTKFADEMLAGSPDHLKREIMGRGKAGRPIETKRFKMGESRAADSLEGMFAEGKPVTKADAYRVREAKNSQEEYAYSLSEDFHKMDQEDTSHGIKLQQWTEKLPESLKRNDALKEKLYTARENDAIGKLSANERLAYNKHLHGLFKENDAKYDRIEELAPGLLGPKVENHQMRIRRGDDPALDAMAKQLGDQDPFSTKGRGISLMKPPMYDRHFQVAVRDSDGKVQVIGINNDGKSFTKWNGHVATEVKQPIDFKVGGKIDINGVSHTMREATTKEIEDNANFEDGKPAKYYHDAVLSAVLANKYLTMTARRLEFIKRQKDNLKQQGFMYSNKKDAPEGYIKPDLPQFEDQYVAPQIAHVMNDYNKAGFKGLAPLDDFSQAITKLLFFNPVPHIMNVGGHWFVARGKDWAMPQAYMRLFKTSVDAIKSVVTQDDYQRQIADAGASNIYRGILQKDSVQQLGEALGHDIQKHPETWKKTADILGVGVPELGRAIYRQSSKIMWAVNDIMLTQLIKENEAKGMTLRGAIATAHKDFPNYRVGATLLNSGVTGRVLSQAVQSKSIFAFGPYHTGMINSFGNIVKDLVKGGKDTAGQSHRIEAIGKLMALGILAFMVKPLLDKAVQIATGNKNAYANPRGPLTVPTALYKAGQGQQDPQSALRNVMAVAPALTTALEAYHNQNFAGKPIIQPGDVKDAVHGNVRAAGNVAYQAGSHLAKGLVAPLNIFSQGADKMVQGKKVGILGSIRDQLLDAHNTSDPQAAFMARQPKKTQQAIKASGKAGNEPFGH